MHVIFKRTNLAATPDIVTAMPSLTTNQKIAIAVSVPVAGILLYFLLRWARDEDDFVDDDAVEREEADEFIASSDLVSEVQIQQCHVGAIIGRGGSVIRQIQKESQTRINFKDDGEESEDEVNEEAKPRVRTIFIRGSRERIKQAEVLIQKVIDEQPVVEKVKVEIPQRLIGRIIGKGGKTIRQLCRVSGAKIKVDCDNEMGEVRTCDIVGTESQIEYAKQLIEEKISEDKEFRAKRAKDKLKFAHVPVDGDYFAVYVSAMETPGHFWIQNVTKNSKQLDDLVEEMTEFYGDKGQGHRLIPPKVGDLCSATFKHDESWYRGEIVDVLEESSEVQIHYLDFGDTGVVSTSHVKEIRKEFCYLPFQAIECYLANVKPKGEKWSQEACDAFEKLSKCAQWKALMARVMYYNENGLPCVELFDTNEEQDVNIEKQLVEQGYAVYKEKTPHAEKEDSNKSSNSPSKSSQAAVEQIIAEQKEISLKQMNEQFRSPGFENVSFDFDRSESFEFSSPITASGQGVSPLNEKGVVDEATIAPVEQKVVSCVDISQLESLFGMSNVNPNVSLTDGVDLRRSEIGGTELDKNEDKNELRITPLQIKEDSDLTSNTLIKSKAEGQSFANPIQEHGLVTEEMLRNSENDHISFAEPQENSEKDYTASNELPKSLEATKTASEPPVTSSVANNAEDNVEEKALREVMAVASLSAATKVSSEKISLLTPDTATQLLKNNDNQTSEFNDVLLSKDVSNSSLADENPLTSTSDYHPNRLSDPAVKSTSTGSDTEEKQEGGAPDNGSHRMDHVLRRSCSEDLTADDTRTDGNLIKSSSEIAVSPCRDKHINNEDGKAQLSSRSLGSLSSLPKGGKRVLAANFGQMANNRKHESDMDDEEDDDDSIYHSAKEDSDSTGFLSAIGSRTSLRIDSLSDTDSDATPSGYLSEPEGNSNETGETADLADQARLDTTLLVEKLEQYADE